MQEFFVSNEENDQIVQKIFTILGYSILTLVVYGTLIWAYYLTEKNQHLFIAIFSLFVLFYSIIVISIVVINKSNYDALSYLLLFGITIFVIFTSVFVCVFFILKFLNIISSAPTALTVPTVKSNNYVANMANMDIANMDYRRNS
jgi:hypothetical protein